MSVLTFQKTQRTLVAKYQSVMTLGSIAVFISVGNDVMVSCCFYKQTPQIYYTEEVLFISKESIKRNLPCRIKD
jgi:hypothetical protein